MAAKQLLSRQSRITKQIYKLTGDGCVEHTAAAIKPLWQAYLTFACRALQPPQPLQSRTLRCRSHSHTHNPFRPSVVHTI